MEEMSRKKLSEFVIIMVMIMIMGINECCIESERNGLLEIKSSFNSSDLSSWGNLTDECCNWLGVHCNSTTGHVTELDLSFITHGLQSESSFILNASVFLPFQQLNLLSLMQSNIVGCIQNQGFERLSTLANLEFLDLSYNRFNNTILRSLSGLQALKSLNLACNELKGTIDMSELSYLPSALAKLSFSGNEIEAFESTEGYERLSPLVNLEVLDLSANNITLCSLSGLHSLKSLDLRINYLKRATDISGFCNLKRLQDFDMSYNDLNGNLPQCLGNMSFLQSLDISVNRLRIPISLSSFFNLSKLRALVVSDNIIYEDTENHNLIPKFQLEGLYMEGYGEGAEIPKFLYHQHNLQELQISSMKLRGGFPYWLLQNNSRLETLILQNNSFSGPIQLPNHPHVNLTVFDISHNSFYGSIPSNVGILFPNLVSFRMSGNNLKGNIPVSICNITELNLLDISRNALSGRIPKCFGNMCPEILDLSENNISGSLPTFVCASLQVVKLSKNKLQGSLEDAFNSCCYLLQLDLSHNNISGTIPSWIGELSQLIFLVLGYNNFQGHIPIELCHLEGLSFIDLSHNNIVGHMIPCLNLAKYWSSDPSKLYDITDIEITVKGRTYTYERKVLEYVSGIDISCNNMTGDIPTEIGNLTGIKLLNLSQNFFTGEIPPTFSDLKEIESLDLSLNHLQGMIPSQLTKLTYLSAFNVSYNNLSGPVPNAVNQFATFNESSYKGNPFLCGLPLSKRCGSADSPPSNARIFPNHDNSRNKFIDMEDFFVSFGISYGTVLLTLAAILCINPYWRRVWFYYVQMSIDKTYYFVIDNVVPLFSKFWFSFSKF